MKKLEVNLELFQNVLKRGTAFALAGTIVLGGHTAIVKDNNFCIQTACAAEEQDIVKLDVQTGINLYMNDKGFVPKDVNGNETYPFICDGTTYVPIRAVAELFNATVNWDEKTRTVVIATTGESANLTHTYRPKQDLFDTTIIAEKGVRLVINGKEVIPKDVNGNIKDIYIVNGTTYVPVRAVSEALDLPINWSDKTNSVFIGKHKTTGLTVENMEKLYDPVVYYEISEDIYHGGDWAMSYQHPSSGYVIVTCNGYVSFISFLLNEEYYDASVYKKMYEYKCYYETNGGEVKDDVFVGYKHALVTFASRIPYADSNSKNQDKPFDWDKVIINPEYAEFLNKYQTIGYQAYIQQDYTILKQFIEDYLYGKDGDFHYGKTHPVIDALVTVAPLYKNNPLKYPITSKEYSDFYNAFRSAEVKLILKHEELYAYLFKKELTK